MIRDEMVSMNTVIENIPSRKAAYVGKIKDAGLAVESREVSCILCARNRAQ